MKIQVESNDFDEVARCHLCGTTFRLSEVVSRAYDDADKFLTDVCPDCIAAGPDGMRQRILQQAESLRSQAADLEQLAKMKLFLPVRLSLACGHN